MTFLEWHHQKFGAFLNRRPPYDNLPVLKSLPPFVYKIIAVVLLWYFPGSGFIWIPLWYRSAKKKADQNQTATLHRGIPGAQFVAGNQGVATQQTQSHSGGTAMSQGFDGNGPCKACGFVYQMKFEQAVCPSCSHRMSRDDAFFACAGFSGPTPTSSQQPKGTGTQAPASQSLGHTWANIWHGKYNAENPYLSQNIESGWAELDAKFPPGKPVFFDCPQCGTVIRSDSGLPNDCLCSGCGVRFSMSQALNIRATLQRPKERGLIGRMMFGQKTTSSYREQLESSLDYHEQMQNLSVLRGDKTAALYHQQSAAEIRAELRRI